MHSISETAKIIGDKNTSVMIFFNFRSPVEWPSRREDFKFRHILYPATVYPTQINIPQMKRARYETKYQNSLSAYKTSKLNVSMIVDKTSVIESNTQMFWSDGVTSEVFVVSSSTSSKMLNADRLKAIEKQSTSSDAVKVPIDASFNEIGLQSSAATLSVAARNNWAVVKRAWIFRLRDWGCVHCLTRITQQQSAKTPNKAANVYV